MFIATLFTVERTWKQAKCPSTEQWIKERWYTHAMEHYSAMKRREVVPFTEMRMDLEIVI